MVEQGTHKPQVTGSNPVAVTNKFKIPHRDQGIPRNSQAYSRINPNQGIPLKQAIDRFLLKKGVHVHAHLLRHTFATLWLKNGGDSLMLQRLLGDTTLMMTNRYCQAVGCYDAVESHKRYSPVDNLRFK